MQGRMMQAFIAPLNRNLIPVAFAAAVIYIFQMKAALKSPLLYGFQALREPDVSQALAVFKRPGANPLHIVRNGSIRDIDAAAKSSYTDRSGVIGD